MISFFEWKRDYARSFHTVLACLAVPSFVVFTNASASTAKSFDSKKFPIIGPCYEKLLPKHDPKVPMAVSMCFFSRSRVVLATVLGEGQQVLANWRLRDNVISFNSTDIESGGPFSCEINFTNRQDWLLFDCGTGGPFTGIWHLNKSHIFKPLPEQYLEK